MSHHMTTSITSHTSLIVNSLQVLLPITATFASVYGGISCIAELKIHDARVQCSPKNASDSGLETFLSTKHVMAMLWFAM